MEKEKHLRKNTQKRAESAVYTAAQLFLRRGIEDVKMTDVAEASGIGVASLYRWFGTKESLVVQAGTLLWRDLDALFENIYKADDFHKKSGYAQIEALLGIYRTLFSEHAPFIRFVANFDDFVIREGLDAEVLSQYEKSILDFYPHFLRSFEAGLADGSVRAGLDPRAYYETVNHAVMALAQKLLRGEILGGDRFAGSQEPELLLKMALAYIRTV